MNRKAVGGTNRKARKGSVVIVTVVVEAEADHGDGIPMVVGVVDVMVVTVVVAVMIVVANTKQNGRASQVGVIKARSLATEGIRRSGDDVTRYKT